jgi:hypothetical protein
MPACATARTVARQPAALTPGTLPLAHPHPPADHRRHVHPDISVWALVLLHCCATLLHHPTAQEPPPFGLIPTESGDKKTCPNLVKKAERKTRRKTRAGKRTRALEGERCSTYGQEACPPKLRSCMGKSRLRQRLTDAHWRQTLCDLFLKPFTAKPRLLEEALRGRRDGCFLGTVGRAAAVGRRCVMAASWRTSWRCGPACETQHQRSSVHCTQTAHVLLLFNILPTSSSVGASDTRVPSSSGAARGQPGLA